MMDEKQERIKGDILVVDNNPSNLRLLSKMLTERGYDVRKVLTGKLALIAADRVAPDLVLLDILMPGMNGYEVCTQLKASPKTRDIPVIFLSLLSDEVDKVKAFEVGGVDYITKPFHVREVLARVESQMIIRRLQKKLTEQNIQLQAQNLQLQQLNAELVSSNSELDEFAHIASHDLQSPLGTIASFVQLLARKYRGNLDAKADEYLAYILESVANMRQLINDLLTYSRAGRSDRTLVPTDCNKVLERVQANLQVAIANSGGSLTYDSLPTIMADSMQLGQLFQNLIDNAIKFCPPNTSPEIRISVEQKDREWVIGIHDNGIGIEPKNFERIFESFQRLHSAFDYPGTGIGLAVCKKIVERHQGRIWVESKRDSGTTFYFTIPLIQIVSG